MTEVPQVRCCNESTPTTHSRWERTAEAGRLSGHSYYYLPGLSVGGWRPILDARMDVGPAKLAEHRRVRE